MARYIDADEAIRISKEDRFMWAYDLTDLEEFLTNVPTIEARPVVRGEWLPIMFYTAVVGVKCSECNTTRGAKSNFCPSCGADMRGENNAAD